MKSPANDITEPPPGPEAPPVIHLPYVPVPEPPQTEKKKPKRQRRHVERFRTDDAEHAEIARRANNAGLTPHGYFRLCVLGGPGPRARRRAAVDEAALMRALVAFNRAHNNLNQIARALNTLAIFAEEHGAARVEELLDELRRPADLLEEQFAPPVAAILQAVGHVREG